MKGSFRQSHTPSLYIQNRGEDISTKAALSLTRARDRVVVRITGGCGNMSPSDAEGLYDLYARAFGPDFGGSLLFGGVLLFGGTRMYGKKEPHDIVHSITEVGPLIGRQCPESVVLGVVPRTGDMKISDLGLVIENNEDKDFVTVIHPEQDVCLVLQQTVDQEAPWDTEYLICLKIIEQLVSYVEWKHLLISYNGGPVTEREILAWAGRQWPVLLIKGSGRKSDEYANDQVFLRDNPSVHVAEKDATAMREKLIELGIVPGDRLRLRIIKKKEGETNCSQPSRTA